MAEATVQYFIGVFWIHLINSLELSVALAVPLKSLYIAGMSIEHGMSRLAMVLLVMNRIISEKK